VAFGQSAFTDLDFADDVSVLAKLLELLVPILETMASEAASLGLEVNWQKTKVQALGCREDVPLTINVQGQDVMVVEEFVYLGSLIHSSTGSTCDISRQSAITLAATQSLENQIWRSRLATSTKLKLYNTYILPIFLYSSDCGRYQRRTQIGSMHSTSDVCVCCLASNGTNLSGTMMYRGYRSNPNSLLQSSRAGLPYLGILCAWTTMQMPRGSC